MKHKTFRFLFLALFAFNYFAAPGSLASNGSRLTYLREKLIFEDTVKRDVKAVLNTAQQLLNNATIAIKNKDYALYLLIKYHYLEGKEIEAKKYLNIYLQNFVPQNTYFKEVGIFNYVPKSRSIFYLFLKLVIDL